MEWLAHYDKEPHKEQSLQAHAQAVAEHCGTACKKIGLYRLGVLIGLLHDAGKATAKFQAYLKDPTPALRGKINHSACGGRFLAECFTTGKNSQGVTAVLAQLAICGHHSGLPDCISLQGEDLLDKKIFSATKEDYQTAIANFTADCIKSAQLRTLFLLAVQEVKVLMDKVLQFCKTLPPKAQKEQMHFMLGLTARYLHSALIDADRYDTYLFFKNKKEEPPADIPAVWNTLAEKLEIHIAKFPQNTEINRVRAAISVNCFHFTENGAGVYQMYVPTGGGKTFSSMRFALQTARKHGLSHVFYIAPFKTILEQNAAEIRKALQDKSMILEHHSDVLPEKKSCGEEEDRYSLLTQRWDSPIILTTMVQFLNTLFSGKSASARRFHALSRSVILLDEIQALPARFVSMLNTAINFLTQICGCTVVLCTATQPMLSEVPIPLKLGRPAQMVPQALTQASCFCRTRLVDLTQQLPFTAEDLAEFTAARVAHTESVLLILNTKSAARKAYKAVQQCIWENSENMYYLSTGLCPQHRIAVLKEIREKLNKHTPIVCISTQLIEAGVDISFDCVIRSLAGLDHIAQAAGRCNRNGKSSEPRDVYIIKSADENLTHLPDICKEQLAAAAALDAFRRNPAAFGKDLLSVEAIRLYYQFYYRDTNALNYKVSSKDDPHLVQDASLYDLLSFNTPAKRALVEQNKSLPDRLMHQAFYTAGKLMEVISNNTTDVLVPYQKGKDLIAELLADIPYEKIPALIKRAQRFMVQLYDNEIRVLQQKQALYTAGEDGVLILREQFYHEKTGISYTTGEMPLQFC